LLKNIRTGKYRVFVLFPLENKELDDRKVAVRLTKVTDQTPAFIIPDGTWKEARKIFRKSDYLGELPIISLEPNRASDYDLRRGAAEGNLCTIEAAIEILKMVEEGGTIRIIEEYYKLFLKSYKAGVSGHELKG
jgi:hypothetical protein